MSPEAFVTQSTGSWVERDFGIGEAFERAQGAIRELELLSDLTEMVVGPPLSVWTCHLRDADGQLAPDGIGHGKGGREESRTGALFEALEHHLTGPAFFDINDVLWSHGRDLADETLGEDVCAPLLAIMGRLACLPYRALAADAAPVLLPVCLTTSWYYDRHELRAEIGDDADYTRIARYGSNSGSAIGANLAEALVHAINETVERDALSLLLASAWPGGSERPLRVVDPATLSVDLAPSRRQVERLCEGTVHLLDATTDIGVPTYVAVVDTPGPFATRFGAGTALCPHYAAWRALGELAQVSLARGEGTSLDTLDRYPQLRACATFDLGARLARSQRVALPAGEPVVPGAENILRELTRRLTAAGYPVYYRVVATIAHGVTAVHVFVPGLERFMLVVNGMAVIPGPRARAQIAAA